MTTDPESTDNPHRGRPAKAYYALRDFREDWPYAGKRIAVSVGSRPCGAKGACSLRPGRFALGADPYGNGSYRLVPPGAFIHLYGFPRSCPPKVEAAFARWVMPATSRRMSLDPVRAVGGRSPSPGRPWAMPDPDYSEWCGDQ